MVEVKDAAAFAKTLDGAVTKMQAHFRDRVEANTKSPPVRIHPLEGIADGYSVSVSPTVAPLPAGFRPTLVMGKKSLIVASNPEDARSDPRARRSGGLRPVGLGSAGALPRPTPGPRDHRERHRRSAVALARGDRQPPAAGPVGAGDGGPRLMRAELRQPGQQMRPGMVGPMGGPSPGRDRPRPDPGARRPAAGSCSRRRSP